MVKLSFNILAVFQLSSLSLAKRGETSCWRIAKPGEVVFFLNPWIGQSPPYESVAWVVIHGVPPHLLSLEVFNTVGQKYGKVIQPSQIQENDGDLTFDRLRILTNTGNRINDALNLKWYDKHYRVWVVEENDPWIPDFLEEGEDQDGWSSELGADVSDHGDPSQASGNRKSQEVEEVFLEKDSNFDQHGGTRKTAHVDSCEILRNDENVKRQVFNKTCFGVKDKNKDSGNKVGTSFVDNWVNFVGLYPPRPKKRRRQEDLFSLNAHLGRDKEDCDLGPRNCISSDSLPNLNITPEVSVFKSEGNATRVDSGDSSEEGEIIEDTKDRV
ncbi:hypothetical protein HanIR_Chr12g0593851 [Helianthus annuus]|nr:hypothetical protein HanIR_Chr12g0593851 [Helianthus annuus]